MIFEASFIPEMLLEFPANFAAYLQNRQTRQGTTRAASHRRNRGAGIEAIRAWSGCEFFCREVNIFRLLGT
jgi:hypothetical protein